MPTTTCACGCGNPVGKKRKSRFASGHSGRWVGHQPRTFVSRTDGYAVVGRKRVHVLVAEKALGKPLPRGAQVHHVNGNRSDNRPENLVVCQDGGYHALLHLRQSLDACGNAGWLLCIHCKAFDDPQNLSQVSTRPRMHYHKACARVYVARNKARRRAVARRL